MPDFPKSIRHRILENITANLASITASETPAEDGWQFEFGEVTREQVENIAVGKRAVCGVYPGAETKKETAGIVMDCSLELTIEVHVRKDANEKLSDMLEIGLLIAERRIMEDQECGGLALDITITGSDPELEGPYKNQAMAALYATVRYRHHRDNPATAID